MQQFPPPPPPPYQSAAPQQMPATYAAATPTPRRTASGSSPYVLTPSYTASTSGMNNPSLSKQSKESLGYQHNPFIMIFLGIPLFCILWNSVSPAPLQTFLFGSLFLYAIDLAGFQEGYMIVLWIGFAVLSMVNGWTHLMSVEDHEASGYNMVLVIMKLMVESLLFLCMVGSPTVIHGS